MNNEYSIRNTPIHPGEVLAFVLEAWGMSKEELSEKANIDFTELCRFINCEIPVSHGIAAGLSNFFGISNDSWQNLQISYENEKRILLHGCNK